MTIEDNPKHKMTKIAKLLLDGRASLEQRLEFCRLYESYVESEHASDNEDQSVLDLTRHSTHSAKKR